MLSHHLRWIQVVCYICLQNQPEYVLHEQMLLFANLALFASKYSLISSSEIVIPSKILPIAICARISFLAFSRIALNFSVSSNFSSSPYFCKCINCDQLINTLFAEIRMGCVYLLFSRKAFAINASTSADVISCPQITASTVFFHNFFVLLFSRSVSIVPFSYGVSQSWFYFYETSLHLISFLPTSCVILRLGMFFSFFIGGY